MGMKGFFYLPGLKEAYIMDKEKNTRLPLVDLIEVKPMQDGYRWVAITAMLFAIGIILHTVSPNVGGVTPNWTIAMYSIVINLTNPTLSQAVGIGFIAGITLVLERPFGIGDYIVLGDCEGTVEDISFRSTRIRTPDNVAITIENSKITAEYIQNYDRRRSRLWKFTIGLTSDTPREKIEQLTADLTAMLQAQPDVQPDGVTIALDKFNDYSIDLACRVYITKVNLRDFMQVKNTLNLQILDLMQEEGCEFAFPTTTVDLPERK